MQGSGTLAISCSHGLDMLVLAASIVSPQTDKPELEKVA
jgi:hypothetical protein